LPAAAAAAFEPRAAGDFPYSMIVSAAASSDGGMVIPNSLAVRRLTASRKRVGG
jgi:hypothetical protein